VLGCPLEAVELVEVLGRERPHEPRHAALAVAHRRRYAAAPRRAPAREAEAVAVQNGGPDQVRARAWAPVEDRRCLPANNQPTTMIEPTALVIGAAEPPVVSPRRPPAVAP